MMGETSQTQKDTCHMFSLVYGNRYANPAVGNEMLVTRHMQKNGILITRDMSWSTSKFGWLPYQIMLSLINTKNRTSQLLLWVPLPSICRILLDQGWENNSVEKVFDLQKWGPEFDPHKPPGMVMLTYTPSTREAETGSSPGVCQSSI